ncbi:PPIC-type PPIASE domain [Yoonia vestfoldensis SKA53]|uniref:Parvulin-like PPIase n=2 Tax=Yoonia vestfoldensis TaxID=245188 RepID=A3V6E5_9RHOB|nr:PPIC-type PPIASE domain [Yoonia vestfoldensis SKA53]
MPAMTRKEDRMRAFSTWTAVLALALGLGQPATAQNQFAPAITVNERVITQYELTQRIRLLEVFGTRGDIAQAARDALIADRLKQQEIDRVGLQVPPEAINAALDEFAGRADMDLAQFNAMLAQNGVDAVTLRDFVSIGVTWREYVRARFNREVTVTDADIARAQGQIGRATSEMEVLLNEIIIAAPPEMADRAAQAADQIAQMRSFADFEAAARQVSALPSRDQGGQLDWLPIANYPPQLQSLILDLDTGEVTEPIMIPNGIALFQMRGKREALRPAAAPASIDYAAYFIAGGQSDAALQMARDIANNVDTCDDLYGVARNRPADVLDRRTLPPAEIAQDIALELARLDPNEVSTNLTRDNGQTLVFLMLCQRNAAGAAETDPDALRNQIRGQRLTTLADALVEDLRAQAVIVAR